MAYVKKAIDGRKSAKITLEQSRAIKQALVDGVFIKSTRVTDIARVLGVSRSTVESIKIGRTWKERI
jgi:hypothetical protein